MLARGSTTLAAALAVAVLLVGEAAPAETAVDRLRVRYTGPTTLAGTGAVRAAASGPARVVAVTFALGGRPLVTDTTPPFSPDVDTRLLPRGPATLRVTAVDAEGRRATAAARVRVVPSRRRVVLVRSQAELAPALAALARGHTTVVLRPGTYVAESVRLGDGARLAGAGPKTVLRAAPGRPYWAVLVADGRRIRVSDLTVDGGGPGEGIGHAIVVQSGSSDVRLSRVRVRNVRKVGVFAWGAYSEVSVQDSQITGGPRAGAGVIAGESGRYGTSSHTSVVRTTLRDFEDFGILFAHREHGRVDAARRAVALDNVVRNVADPERAGCGTVAGTQGCGTNEGGIWSGSYGAAIIGNRVSDTRWDGIQTVGSSTSTSVVGNRIERTRTGIYLEHATNHSLIARNAISNVDTGINVEWEYGGVASRFNRIRDNRVVRARRVGLFVDVGADGNRIVGNVFTDTARPAIVLQGSSGNLVRLNRACGGEGQVVQERAGRRETGSLAVASGNTIADNAGAASCR